MKSVASRDCDSFLPPDFGLLDRPEVRVVDHAVLASLGGGNDPVGRQHGVLLLSSRIILEDKQVTDGKQFSWRELITGCPVPSLTAMIFPATFSPSVWSSCSDESVSSRLCNSSSEGRRALRYGIELGRAAMTGNTHKPKHIQAESDYTQTRTRVFPSTWTHGGRWWCRLWKGSEFLPSLPWTVWELAPHLVSDSPPSPSELDTQTQVLWTSVKTHHFMSYCWRRQERKENSGFLGIFFLTWKWKAILTHGCFDVGVRVWELWEVAGNVGRMGALMSSCQCFRCDGGVGHRGWTTTENRHSHRLLIQGFFRNQTRGREGHLTSSYHHPLWSLGVHGQRLSIKTWRHRNTFNIHLFICTIARPKPPAAWSSMYKKSWWIIY